MGDLNRELLVLEDVSFIPVIVTDGDDATKAVSQGVQTPASVFYPSHHSEKPRIEQYSFFTFYLDSSKQEIPRPRLFRILSDAMDERANIARSMGLDESEILIVQSRRIISRFKNAGNLPIKSARFLYNIYTSDRKGWRKLYSDTSVASYPTLVDIIESGGEVAPQTGVGTKVTDPLPDEFLITWEVEYYNVTGQREVANFARLYQQGASGGYSWRSISSAGLTAITKSAVLLPNTYRPPPLPYHDSP